MSIQEQVLRSIVEGGQIKLREPVPLADGTVVKVTITVAAASDQARERQHRLLREGLHLGGPPYPEREDLYE